MRVKVTGVPKITERLNQLGGLPAAEEVGRVIHLTCEEIIGEAKDLAPVMDGHLRASGHVSPVEVSATKVSNTAGFGGPSAPYALAVHENPRSGKTEGRSPSGKKYKRWAKVGEWKYLEKPFQKIAPRLGDRITRALMLLAKRLGRAS